MKKKHFYIGVDLGGTKMMVGLFSPKLKLLSTKKSKVLVEKGAKNFLDTLYDQVEKILAEAGGRLKDVKAIGMGCPGMIRFNEAFVDLSPNIPFLNQYPLGKKLKRLFGVPVIVENDANAGLYGEQQFGAARGYSNVAGIFLGTGVGGAFILDDKLYRGTTGGAGEIGHMIMDLAQQRTLENHVGRLAIASDAAVLAARQKAPHLFKLAGTDIRQMKSGVLRTAIRQGDQALEKLIMRKDYILGIAMANIVNLLNPELIVLGGGLIEALGNTVIVEARKIMKQYAMPPLVREVQVAPALLHDFAIIYGAAKLGFDSLKD